MKKLIFVITVLCILFTSCAPINYFQVYQTSSDNVKKVNKTFVFEDDYCKIYYTFWDDKGDAGFLFENKTDLKIYLNLDECYFIKNDLAFDYFQNRTFIFPGYEKKESKIVTIPPKTIKLIKEFVINSEPIRDCDLYRFPINKKHISSINFNSSNSPIIFGNTIVYSVEFPENKKVINNFFYVSEITNYPNTEMIIKEYEEYCGEKSTEKVEFIKDVSPDKFYIKYNRPPNAMKY